MASSDDRDRVPRRDVLGVAVGGSLAAFAVAVAYPVARFVDPPSQTSGAATDVGRLADFPVHSAKIVTVHDRPVLVVRSADGALRAFSALCTHLHCVVSYSAERNQIECPCHRGVFSMDGENIEGPPPRPLDELAVTVRDGSVIVSPAG